MNLPLIETSNSIFILYMLIGANFLANLFGCRIQNALNNSMWLKHAVGFMTLLFFVVMVDKSDTSPMEKMTNTLMYYFVFLLTTRMDIKWWTPFIMSVFAIYILQMFKDAEKNAERKEKLERIQKMLANVSYAMLAIGLLVYVGRKKGEYKETFNFTTFLMGKPSCAANSDGGVQLSDFDAIKKAFS